MEAVKVQKKSDQPKILLVDNYDSFTYNLYDYFLQLNADCRVIRNDELTLEEIGMLDFDALVLSPGPKKPQEAGLLMALIDFYHDKKPILGICLGHQGIGQYFGATLQKAALPMHGKTSAICHNGSAVFHQLPNPLRVMRYHSLILDISATTDLEVTAQTAEGEIMAFIHKKWPITGLQFHPESILTEKGLEILGNWLDSLRSGLIS